VQGLIAAPKTLGKSGESLHFRTKMPQSHRKKIKNLRHSLATDSQQWGGPPLQMLQRWEKLYVFLRLFLIFFFSHN